jgi:amino acid transporter
MAEAVGQGVNISVERRKLKRELTLLPLFGLIYFTVCGGSFGAEPMVGQSGPGMALLLFIVTPILFSIPNMLMVREMQSMMPHEGGYYHWVKQAFGPFVGFMTGWMNWVVSWVDVSIYPVWTALYLSAFIPALNDGATIFGLAVPGWVLSWLVSLTLIWLISALNIRGARLSGLFTDWLGLVMMIPLVALTVVGFYNWIHLGTSFHLTLLPGGQPVNFRSLTGAFSVGLFVAMWNFMGWELPTAAGSEIVNPKRTYPLAMVLVLIAAIVSYSLPTIAGLYGGAGEGGRYQVWGIEESENGVGIGADLEAQGVRPEDLQSWGVDPQSAAGWEFTDIAYVVGAKAAGEGSPLSLILGGAVTFAAVLSMTGLFIGNGLGGTRVPFALAEDGMMPKWLVKVHPRFGTPWVSILICGVIFSIFSLQAFAFLVVIDVLINALALMLEFFSLWALRFKRPDLSRQAVPGGWVGLTLVTLAPLAIITVALVSYIVGEGWVAVILTLAALALGAILYVPIRRLIKPGVPDVDPYRLETAAD